MSTPRPGARSRRTATYTHDDRAWIVQFHDPDIATFGRTLTAAKRYARSALAVHLEVDDLASAGVDVVDDVRLPPAVDVEVDPLVEERTRVDAMRSALARSTRRAAADLRRLGFSTRDVGEILAISGSRVAQMDREAGST